MKTVVTTALTLLTLTSSVFGAETKWAQGPFFKAPQATVINTKLTYSTHPDLVQECGAYQTFIDGLRSGSTPIDSVHTKRVDNMRKRRLASQKIEDRGFKATFKVEGLENFMSEVLVSAQADSAESERLPFFNKAKAFTSTDDLRKLDYAVVVKPASAAQALTTVSSSLNLIPSTVTVLESRGDLFLEVDGRDLACDLLSKSAVLSNTSKGYVRISKEESEELGHFYNGQVSPIIKKIITNTSESAVKRAAKLGFQFGKALEDLPARYDEKEVEGQIGNLMDLLFTKDLTPTARVIRDNGSVLIDVESGFYVDAVTLNLGVF